MPWGLARLDLGDHVLELGPGAGLVTRPLAMQSARVTAIDRDPSAVDAVHGLAGVNVVCGDAAHLPFATGTFSAVVAFTTLHHIPTEGQQQCLFREASRALRPGGVFVGVDPRFSVALWLFHIRDTCVPIAPNAVGPRLVAAGFEHISVDVKAGYLRFCARTRVEQSS